MSRSSILHGAIALLTIFLVPSRAASAQIVLTADSLEDSNQFGEAVATSNGWAAVGAHGWSATFHQHRKRGRVYLFRREQGEWLEWGTRLSPESPVDPETFGYALAMSDDTLVVGAPALGETTAVDFAGAVYVYVYDGADWVLNSRLTPSDGVDQDQFGSSVAISDGLIVVGAPGRAGAEPQWTWAGAAYAYRYGDGSWEEEAILVSSDLYWSHYFGQAVAIDGSRIVVGAPGWSSSNETYTAEGAAYVFVEQDGVWTEEQKLLSPRPDDTAHFGSSVAMGGDEIFVGEIYPNWPFSTTGFVNLYRREESGWHYKYRIVPDDAALRDFVGSALALNGNLLLISAPGAYVDGSTRRVGAAYLYRWDGQEWTQKVKLSSQDAYNFGYAVALSDTDVVVGADCCQAAWAYDLGALPLAREPAEQVAFDFELASPYPNPFTAGTEFELRVDRTGPVVVTVFDILGRAVGTPFDGVMAAGESRTVQLDGGGLEAGVYFIRVQTATALETISVVRAE